MAAHACLDRDGPTAHERVEHDRAGLRREQIEQTSRDRAVHARGPDVEAVGQHVRVELGGAREQIGERDRELFGAMQIDRAARVCEWCARAA
jgi:hypothetical protein